MVVCSTACVLGEPDHTPPERTRPQLLAIAPPVTEIRPRIKTDSDTFDAIDFDVQLLSEDNGQDVSAVLLINYGRPSPFSPGTPYERRASETVIPAGTLSEGPRLISLSYTPSLVNDTHKCESVTLHVTHERFRQSPYEECAKDINDVATLTWFIPMCDSLGDCDAQDCVGEPEGGYVYCPEDPAAALTEGNQ